MRNTGDPLGEYRVLVALQRGAAINPTVQQAALRTARGMSHFGEHALGWMGLAAAGYALQRDRRWVTVGVSAFTAHAASVVLKRIVRRPRPHHPDVAVGVGTPSRLSFPSSHATSSTAALVGIAGLSGSPLPLAGIPAMALSRMLLGVHYPSDVVLGSLLGFATTQAVTAVLDKPGSTATS